MAQIDNYGHLVTVLANDHTNKKRGSLNIKVKNVPDSDRKGVLDSREFEIIQEQFKAGNIPEFPAEEEIDLTTVPIEEIREKMGYPNKDVTKTQIDIQYKEINGEYGSIPIRIYTPANHLEQMPVILFFHGGAFMGGTLDIVENTCKLFAEKGNAVVISVDYRLAPEHPYPQGLTDCFDTVKWVYEHADKLHVDHQKLVVTGDSAGGNFAAVCALMDRDQGTKMIAYQALIYPSINMGEVEKDDYQWDWMEYNIQDDHELIELGITLLGGQLPLVRRAYLQDDTKVTHPYVAPLFAEKLDGLANTLIITGEFDKFRLENEAYAQVLQEAGVPVELIQYNGLGHGFLDKTGIYPQVEDCINEIVRGMEKTFDLLKIN